MDRLDESRVLEAQELLTRAFDTDPFFRFLFPDPSRYVPMLGQLMRSNLDAALRKDMASAVLEPELAGVCLWWKPKTYPPSNFATVRARAPAIVKALRERSVTVAELLRALRTSTLIEEVLPATPFFYLAILAVDTHRQGQGIGSRMLRACTSEADAAGLPAYLETSKPSNVGLYERHGFQVIRTHHIDGSPPLWTMRRPARGELL